MPSNLALSTRLSERISGLDLKQIIRLGVGVILIVGIGIVGLVMGRQSEYRVLYSNLSDKDGGAIIAQLSQMNVPYKHSEGGGAILVPADRVHDARLRLASQGLPKGSVAGFDLMESNRFGMTQFQERLSFQRGLEGELTRSIQALSSVQNARVHLALPQQNGFFREQQKPSASVLLSLYPGRSLDRTQLAGIVHLVAAAVPEMSFSAVSVLDDSGKLLSSPSREGAAGVGETQQLQHVQQIEQMYSQRIIDILAPIVGRANVLAQVGAEIDFSQTESTSEQHTPNQGSQAGAVRSQQILESSNPAPGTPGAGVPGASSNQPPGPTSAPINGVSQALSQSTAASGNGSKRESVLNYEVDKTVTVVRGGAGIIKRINAAVVLNHKSSVDAEGKVTTSALTEQQLEQITTLVRETIGYNKERGDSVSLMHTPFTVEKQTLVELPFWRRPELLDMARSLIWPVGILLFSALVMLGLIRPALKTLAKTSGRSPVRNTVVDAVLNEETERAQLQVRHEEQRGPSAEELRLEDARKLTRDNPAGVANIVKSWVNVETPVT